MTRHSRNLPDRIRDSLPAAPGNRLAPVLYAGGMLAGGILLLMTKPRIGHVPDPRQGGDRPRRSRWRRAAQLGRDNAQVFAPSNVTDSIGRSLLLGGAALLLARLLDELAGPEDET